MSQIGAEEVGNQKCLWAQIKKKKISTKSYSLYPKGQERGSLARKLLDNNYCTPAKYHRKQNKKLWLNHQPCQQRLSGKPRFPLCRTVMKHPDTPIWWCQRRPRREPGLSAWLNDSPPHLWCEWKLCVEPELLSPPSSNKEPPAGWCQQRLSGEPQLLPPLDSDETLSLPPLLSLIIKWKCLGFDQKSLFIPKIQKDLKLNEK